MATLHRCKAVLIGDEADMLRLNRVLLENVDEYEEPEDRQPYTLDELYQRVKEHAEWEEAGSSFLYSMIRQGAYGTGEPGTGRYAMTMADEGLYAAVFSYDSTTSFQPEDWLALHARTGRIPMFIIHADENFALDKGYLTISNGCVNETWMLMAESWLWLIDQYEAGFTPEEIPARLERLKQAMEVDDWDQSIPELLASCGENLEAIREYPSVTAEAIAQRREAGDFAGMFELQAMLADTFLWDSARAEKYLACIELDSQVWQNVE